MAGALLRATLPVELVCRIDWSTLAVQDASFLDPALGASQADLIFRARLDGTEARLVLLLEHQSRRDPLLPYRLLRYVVRLWERAGPVNGKLPLVVPVVLSQGRRPWRTRRRLSECIEGPAELLEALGPLVPELGFALRDLAEVVPERIQADTDDSVASVAQQWMRAARLLPTAEGFGGALLGAKEQVQEALREGRQEELERLLQYALMVAPLWDAELRRYVRQLGPEAETIMKTAADWLREEGEARGEARGRAESLLSLIRLKFGPPSHEDEARIRGAELAALERWTSRILTATALDELFG